MNKSVNELQVVQVLSALTIPEQIVRDSNIRELMDDMIAETKSVQGENHRLEQLRQEKKDGNFATNWWYDRDDKVEDAQLDLNQAMGRLTQRSSQLLIVNTAISKVLSGQQEVLLKQQALLAEQALELKRLNERIFEQQHEFTEQQEVSNAANQKLLDATYYTQNQAERLVDCITLVREAERKIGAANEELHSALKNEMQSLVAKCDEQVRGALVELRSSQQDFERRQDETTHTWSTCIQDAVGELETNSEALRTDLTTRLQMHAQATSTALAAHDAAATQIALLASQVETRQKGLESTVASLQAQQAKSARQNRIALAFLACVAVLSLGWQVVHHISAA
ncbi:hypothetical protein ABW99_00400 [Pandoraea thiooxydans]|uniref:Uncharacterized protein n=1 Tax=Pandoraea thiooxydans TaxID=445709 RepID=A0A0G3EIV2_9BURK|nr:hypothetical protein ABW99_00400 [Pandoraea thiooxydans]